MRLLYRPSFGYFPLSSPEFEARLAGGASDVDGQAPAKGLSVCIMYTRLSFGVVERSKIKSFHEIPSFLA